MTTFPEVELDQPLARANPHERQPTADSAPVHDASGAAAVAVEPAYSIRVAADPGAPCPLCGVETGSGPVGYHGDQAICDLCLLEASPALGVVLGLVAVTRAYGSVEVASTDERRDALQELGAFARIYERFAAKSGPARRILPRLSVH